MALVRDATHVERLDALFSTYHDDVYGLAQALLRNEQDAEDVTQDERTGPFYQPERATLRTWLTHMTVNACSTHRRHSQIPITCPTKTAMTQRRSRSVEGDVTRDSAP